MLICLHSCLYSLCFLVGFSEVTTFTQLAACKSANTYNKKNCLFYTLNISGVCVLSFGPGFYKNHTHYKVQPLFGKIALLSKQ